MDMETQEQSNWCWAAVATSIHNFLEPADRVTQGQIATPVLVGESQITSGVDCTATPELCNYTAALDDALTIKRNLRSDGFLPDQNLAFESITKWVDHQLPIGVRIVWHSGGAHFVAVDGYREFASGLQQVHVQDPRYGPSFQDYADFLEDYPPGGHWQDTYLVKRNGA